MEQKLGRVSSLHSGCWLMPQTSQRGAYLSSVETQGWAVLAPECCIFLPFFTVLETVRNKSVIITGVQCVLSHILLLKILRIYLCLWCVLPACLGIGYPELELGCYKPLSVWGTNLGSPQEQQVFLTTELTPGIICIKNVLRHSKVEPA